MKSYSRDHFAEPRSRVCGSCGSRYGLCQHTSMIVPALANSEAGRPNRTWTEGEDDLLTEMYWLEGASTKTIAQRLTRSIAAVDNRINKLKRRGMGL